MILDKCGVVRLIVNIANIIDRNNIEGTTVKMRDIYIANSLMMF